MSLRAAVVPVLRARGGDDGEPLSAALLHGEPLYVHAARALAALPALPAGHVLVTTTPDHVAVVRAALGRAGVGAQVAGAAPGVGEALALVLQRSPGVDERAEQGPGVVLLHDPRCPLVPTSGLQDVLDRAETDPDGVHAAARPVTDTVKWVDGGAVRATVDRDGLRALTSPLTVPARVLRRLAAGGGLAGCVEPGDLLDLALARGVPLRWVAAPSMGRRLATVADVDVLESSADVRASAGTAAVRARLTSS